MLENIASAEKLAKSQLGEIDRLAVRGLRWRLVPVQPYFLHVDGWRSRWRSLNRPGERTVSLDQEAFNGLEQTQIPTTIPSAGLLQF
jgi:hypothetical protein